MIATSWQPDSVCFMPNIVTFYVAFCKSVACQSILHYIYISNLTIIQCASTYSIRAISQDAIEEQSKCSLRIVQYNEHLLGILELLVINFFVSH